MYHDVIMILIMTGYLTIYKCLYLMLPKLDDLLKILTSAFFGEFGVSLIDSGGDC